jgi:hypothetical protein
MFGRLWVPDELLDAHHAVQLLRQYFDREDDRYAYSGAAFDTYPADPSDGKAPSSQEANIITDSDLIALTMLGIHITGYAALAVTQYRRTKISQLLSDIPPDASIEDDASEALLGRGAAAWDLWELLRDIAADNRKSTRFGPVAAGKLMARKRPNLIPIEDSQIAAAFRRPAPDRDEHWWDDVRSALRDEKPGPNGTTLADYLASLRRTANLRHLPLLRVLDIIGWLHASSVS